MRLNRSSLLGNMVPVTLIALAVTNVGCATGSYTSDGALVGGGLGAGAGAIIGHQSGHGEAGALIGGTLGAIGGALAGNAQDAWHQRDMAAAELSAIQNPPQPPLTNFDLIRMSQAGLGDEVVVNAVQTRGGQFDLSPDGLIALKASGVSDRVIQHVQTAVTGIASGPPIRPYGPPPPEMVIVHPRPLIDVHVGPPPLHVDFGHPHRHRFRHHRHHRGIALDFHHDF